MKHPPLRIILYPCPTCTTWNASEWTTTPDGKTTKHEHITEFPTIDDARKTYQPILKQLIESIYDPKTDTYSNPNNPNTNFIVQGSHGYCHQCHHKQNTNHHTKP